MRIIARSICLAALAALIPLGTLAAPATAKPTSVKLVLSKRLMHSTAFMHVTGTARLHWTRGDVSIKLTTDGLPPASKLGKRVYVLFASDGAMTDRVGALTRHGMMAGASGMVMMTKIADLYVYAVNAANAKRPGNGVLVLSAMIG